MKSRSKTKIKKGKWIACFHCVECNKELDNHSLMYSHGVCPHCGNSSGSTVVDTDTRSYRVVATYKKCSFLGLFSFWKVISEDKEYK